MAEGPAAKIRFSPGLVGAGVLVVALGFGVPQLFNTAPPAQREPAPAPAAAPSAAAVPALPQPVSPNLGVALLRLGVGMVVVCVLCVLATRYLARLPQAASAEMGVLASLPLGNRCAVHLVRAGGHQLLIGTDAGGAKAVVEFPVQEPSIEAAAADPAPTPPAPTPAPAGAPAVQDILGLLAQLQRPPRSAAPPSD